jgi:hypothetical protein
LAAIASAGATYASSGGRSKKAVVAVLLVALVAAVVVLAAIESGQIPLTGWLPYNERESLMVTAMSASSTHSLVVSVNNVGPLNVTITHILVNGRELFLGNITWAGDFSSSNGAFFIPSKGLGTLMVDVSSLSTELGATYSVVLIDATGSSWPASVTG